LCASGLDEDVEEKAADEEYERMEEEEGDAIVKRATRIM
jgi:hypothetical protein